jgi:hypothetical protein
MARSPRLLNSTAHKGAEPTCKHKPNTGRELTPFCGVIMPRFVRVSLCKLIDA